ncbi:MAG: hypothetical protein KAH35_02675, partial [Candidatus Atribacteria bacterium]|nr:hypothetical protein [Candidatus Atribacteria bacterium]
WLSIALQYSNKKIHTFTSLNALQPQRIIINMLLERIIIIQNISKQRFISNYLLSRAIILFFRTLFIIP